MKYLSLKELSNKWNLSERTISNYCASGKIPGAVIINKKWNIPETASKPHRSNEKKNKNYLLEALRQEQKNRYEGGIYHLLQIDMAYNSNHIEGSKLTHDQTRYIYETRTIGISNNQDPVNIDDIIETVNHFECIDRVIENANYQLTEGFIKQLHLILKTGTSDARKPYFVVGDYKKMPNMVGGRETASPRETKNEMAKLMKEYNKKDSHSFEEIIEFHIKFERIHPFQDGNGRVGRLIIFKECLKNNIVPILIKDEFKEYYYRGLKEWDNQKGYLIDTCLHGQDIVISYLDYFNIRH